MGKTTEMIQMKKNEALAESVRTNNLEGASAALALGADPNTDVMYTESQGCSARDPAIIYAVNSRYEDMAELLLRNGANPNIKDSTHHINAFTSSCSAGAFRAVKALYAFGADINSMDKHGMTGLMQACAFGHSRIIRFILNIPEARDEVNRASIRGYTALMQAVRNGYYGIAKMLIKAGADVNAVDQNGFTPLFTVVARLVSFSCTKRERQNFQKILILLIEQGADVNTRDHEGYTPLIKACSCSSGNNDAVPILLQAGADINAVSDSGETALYRAMLWSLNNIAEILIGAGADVNIQDICGKTPLISAGLAGNIEGMIMLVRAGADISIRNNNGRTAQEVLQAMYPDRYNEWICKLKKEMLKYEEMEETGHTEYEPDFSI